MPRSRLEVESFNGVRSKILKKERPFHLLLGNGFSMAYDPAIFSYNALNTFVAKSSNTLVAELLKIVGSHDFERVMQQLETIEALGEALGLGPDVRQRIQTARESLKASLIDAISALHPEHVFKIPEEKCGSCAAFLKLFLENKGSVFTTNYDLLLYWVLMRSGLPSVDGFGRDRIDGDDPRPAEEMVWSELRWGRNAAGQNVHYVHGALPLFDAGTEIVKEEYGEGEYLLERIANRITAHQYPVFVTAGNGSQKLTHIRHNPYLQASYETLASLSGSLVTFGFRFGEQDEHILEAIKRATRNGKKVEPRLWSLYVGAFSEVDVQRAHAIAAQVKCKVHVFDAKTAPVWATTDGGATEA